jgi:hypothetical protein
MTDLKQFKKIIAFSIVIIAVLSCTVVLMGAFSADSAPQRTPIIASTMQTGTASSSPYLLSIESVPTEQSDIKQDEQNVQALVEAFGKTLKMVALVAPVDVVAQSIEKYYSEYVTPELLTRWQKDPENAPGRVGSSPWPERIDILRTEMNDKNQYTVYGEVIEVTSVELVNSGAAAKRPVTIVVQNVNGRWLISSVTFGEYAQRGPVVYENTQYGFRLYLPETWKEYSIVEEQWEGVSSLAEVVETGTQLLIRHPDWTQQDPRQDIPIMVFTLEQWNALQKGEFFVSAAMSPSKLAGNSKYIFALQARYNYAFHTGFEEVEEILKGNPLWPINPSERSSLSTDIRGNETKVKFDYKVEPDDNTIIVKPSQTINAGLKLIEQAGQGNEDFKKPSTGLFDTTLDIVQEDDLVKLNFFLHNISEQDLKIYFGSGQKYDIYIFNQNGEEVYRWSHDKDFISAIIDMDFKKGEKLSFSEVWDYVDSDGSKVLPGRYTIKVKMLARLENIKSINTDELTTVKDIDIN